MSDPARALIDKWRTWATNEQTKRDLGSDLYAEAVLTCADELASVLSSVPQGWQPIETAPTDDTYDLRRRILGGWMHPTVGWIWGPASYHKHHKTGGYWACNGGYPTHWMFIDPPDLLLPAPQKEP